MPSETPSDAKLLDLIAEEAMRDRATLHRGLTLEDADLESLDVITILFEVEDQFGKRLEPKDLEGCKTLGDLMDLIQAVPVTP
jgi:acyl carrier protein